MVFRFLLDHVRSFRFLLNVLALLSLLLAPATRACGQVQAARRRPPFLPPTRGEAGTLSDLLTSKGGAA
jgi:hypothetical protein